jgi:hypothetical protein
MLRSKSPKTFNVPPRTKPVTASPGIPVRNDIARISHVHALPCPQGIGQPFDEVAHRAASRRAREIHQAKLMTMGNGAMKMRQKTIHRLRNSPKEWMTLRTA